MLPPLVPLLRRAGESKLNLTDNGRSNSGRTAYWVRGREHAGPEPETSTRRAGGGPGLHGQGLRQGYHRPEPTELLRFARDGDSGAVQGRGRLARNIDDLGALIQGLTGKGVRVEFTNESLAFTGEDSPMANLTISVRDAFAEFERSLIRER